MNDFIRMPEVDELKDELTNARNDIKMAIEENPEVAEQSKFALQVLDILEEKIKNAKNLDELPSSEQISVVAHLNLFYTLLEDVFGDDLEDFDDEDFDEQEDIFDFENESEE